MSFADRHAIRRRPAPPSFKADPRAEERGQQGHEYLMPLMQSAGVIVTPETALNSSPILTAILTISLDVGITPAEIRLINDDGSQEPQRKHYLTPILSRTPDGLRTPSRFRAALLGHALRYRGGFAEIVRRGDGRPSKLVLLDPRLTAYQTGPTGRHGYRSGTAWIPADDVLHLSGFGFDGLNGYSIPNLINQAIGVTLGAESYAADFFANGSDPSGVIEMPGKFDTPEALRQFRDGIENRHQGPGNRHRVGVIQQGGKWVQTSTDPEKAQLTETRKYQATDSTRPFRLPPHKYGDFSEAHIANLDASNVDYLMTSLMSWFVGFEEEANLKLITEREWLAGFRVVHDLEALLRGDPVKRYQCHEIAVRNGWRSRNEVRRREGDRSIPADHGGDLYTIQAQVIPLDKAGVAFAANKDQPTPSDPPAQRAELRFNPNHDPRTGRFTSKGGRGGIARAATPSRVRGEQHAALLAEQKAERRELARDLKTERRETAKDQRAELKDLGREQEREVKDLDRQQAQEVKDLDRDQHRETRDLDKEQAREIKDHERAKARGEEDDDDGRALSETHAHDRDNLKDDHANAREELKETQAQERTELAEEHVYANQSLLDQHAEDRKGQREDARESIKELITNQREAQADLLRDLRDRRP